MNENPNSQGENGSKRPWVLLVSILSIVLVFSADLTAPLGIAIGVLYFPIQFFAAKYLSLKELGGLTAFILLMLVTGTFSSPEFEKTTDITWQLNRLISAAAILTSYFILRLIKRDLDLATESRLALNAVNNAMGVILFKINRKTGDVEFIVDGMLGATTFSYGQKVNISALSEQIGDKNYNKLVSLLKDKNVNEYFEINSSVESIYNEQPWFTLQGYQSNVDKNIFFCACQNLNMETKKEKLSSAIMDIFNLVPCLVWISSNSGILESVNAKVKEVLGYDKSTITSSLMELIHPEDFRRIKQKREQGRQNKEPAFSEFRVKAADGRYVSIAAQTAPIYDSNHNILKWVGSAVDISELKELAKENLIWNKIIETMSRAVIVFEKNEQGTAKTIYVNDAFQKLTGQDKSEAIGIDPNDFFELTNFSDTKANHANMFTERSTADSVITVTVQNRKQKIIEFNCFPVDPEDSIYVLIVKDATEQEALREITETNKRMDSIGHLTGGVAHDFNNILAVVAGNLELTKLSNLDVRARGYIDTALQATNQGARLTDSLLMFAKGAQPQLNNINVEQVLKEVITAAKPALKSDIKLCTTNNQSWNILADDLRLENVFLNLINNASDALASTTEPQIILQIEKENISENVSAALDITAGEYLKVSIIDNGPGLEPDKVKNIFSPFFTTKSKIKGTGLGLTMVYAYMRDIGGAITVESALNRGTTFSLYFKVGHEPKIVGQQSISKNHNFNGMLAIVIEDNPKVAMVLKSYLNILNFEVKVFKDGIEAMSAAESVSTASFIMTDIDLPQDIDGYAVAKCYRALYPNLPVIYSSGLFDDDHDNKSVINSFTLAKPYSRVDLTKLLCDIFE